MYASENPIHNMYIEEDDMSFIRNLESHYKSIIYQNLKKRVLVNKNATNIANCIVIEGYVDDTSVMLYKNEKELDICILEIPEKFYNYFIGKNGVIKIKNEAYFNVILTEMGNCKIKVEGIGKDKFKVYVLNKIYNHII